MKFLFMCIILLFTSVSYGQFETVPVYSFETIKMTNPILGQVQNCLLMPVSYEMASHEMESHEKQKRLFGGNREGGFLRELLNRLFNRRTSSRGCGS